MSQENHNPEMELTSVQEQYQSLQEKLGQQEIVNNNLIHEMLHAGISTFKRRNAQIILTYGLLAVMTCWSWHQFNLRFFFMATSVALFAIIGLFEWFSCRTILKISIDGSDVQTLVRKMERVRARFSLLWIASVLILCLWLMWFVSEMGEKLVVSDLRSSFVMIAAVLIITIILVIYNIDRFVVLSDELLAQASRRNKTTTASAYRHSGAYWTGIAMLALSLIGLVFKLLHWPFGSLLFMAVGLVGILYVILTARHLKRAIPEQRAVIRIAEAASLFLVVGVVFRMMHYPFSGLMGLVGLGLIAVAVLVAAVRHHR